LAPHVVAFLEELFEVGITWDEAELAGLVEGLGALGETPVSDLAVGFAEVRARLQAGDMAEPRRREVEAVVYPKLWKVLEAVRAELPEGEQRARVQVLNRRLARLLATEADPLLSGDTPVPPG
jgi:hypothetical protein